ncbi:Protein of unknown function, partial [Gryllus bimaculatus]
MGEESHPGSTGYSSTSNKVHGMLHHVLHGNKSFSEVFDDSCWPFDLTWEDLQEVCASMPEDEMVYAYFDSELVILPAADRYCFLTVFALVTASALVLNAAELLAAPKQRGDGYRWMVGSLAVSDFINALLTGGTAIANLSTPYMKWVLGAGVCRCALGLQM